MTEFCVYIHSRPDGSPFYVGKGVPRRAVDFAPSRRKAHHKNIVAKYGRENILVRTIDCESETHAFALEVEVIKCYRAAGLNLVNITDGGEGASGHVQNELQKAGFAKGRGKGLFALMHEVSQKNILAGLARGREKTAEWRKTPEGIAHAKRLTELGTARLNELRQEKRSIICADCGVEFQASNPKAMCCSRKCEQRVRRAKEKAERPVKPKYSHSTETRAKMAAAKKGTKQSPETIAKRNAWRKSDA